MEQALASTTPETFAVPPGIQQVVVDSVSGKLPTDATPQTKTETFADYSVPTDFDNVHQKIAFDATTNLPATSLTPPADITYKLYTVLRSEMPNNPNWEDPVEAWALAHGYSYPPGGAEVAQQTPGNGQSVAVNILDPSDGETISQVPFDVTVSAASASGIARVDLSIDGQYYQSETSEPFVFTVNTPLDNGPHTLAAHAVDNSGATADTSAGITLDTDSPLVLTSPPGQSLLQFPATLIAEDEKYFNAVNFYYETPGGTPTLIGPASNINHSENDYNYSLTWQTPPPSGTYQIYAQSDTGVASVKVQVSVP